LPLSYSAISKRVNLSSCNNFRVDDGIDCVPNGNVKTAAVDLAAEVFWRRMAPTETPNRQWLGWLALAGLAVVGVVAAILLLRPQPQMGADEEVFDTVDALYTAVRNRDDKRLGECEARLVAFRAAGKLPADAAETLASIIGKARGGSWDTAAERLYDFMAAQKREGTRGRSHKTEPTRKK
jgi:hypothetical protein